MSRRITEKDLANMLSRVIRTIGADSGPVWSKDAAGNNVSRVGALLIDPGSSTYGRAWKLCRISNEAGGESVILSADSKQELWDLMHAFCIGYDYRNDQ